MRRPQAGGIAAKNTRNPAEAQRFHIIAQQRARFHAFIDEESIGGTARYRFDAECACPCEEVQHPRR